MYEAWPDVPEARRVVMRAVRGKNTKPEMVVRHLTHGMGFRYRLHRNDMPGRPDLVFPGRRKVIFVHGCFWHHHDCQAGRLPKTRRAFWEAKLHGNRARDGRNVAALARDGWKTLIIWECELTEREALRRRLLSFLDTCETSFECSGSARKYCSRTQAEDKAEV